MELSTIEQPENAPRENAGKWASDVVRMAGVGRVYQSGSTAISALAELDLVITRGEFLALTGPSGCGKSTLLSIMGLLDNAYTGSFLLNGVDATALSYATRAKLRNEEIGFIFQAFNLIPQMTVYQNVELPLSYRKALSVGERKDRIRRSLSQVGLCGRESDYPAQLSGGQQQCVAIARALAGSPSLLLADEPTGNLDSQSGTAIMRLFQYLHESGATICIATHDKLHAGLAQRTISLLDGRTVQ